MESAIDSMDPLLLKPCPVLRMTLQAITQLKDEKLLPVLCTQKYTAQICTKMEMIKKSSGT